jgi:hypothetical protein
MQNSCHFFKTLKIDKHLEKFTHKNLQFPILGRMDIVLIPIWGVYESEQGFGQIA